MKMNDLTLIRMKASVLMLTTFLLCHSLQARVFTSAEGETQDADLRSLNGNVVTILRQADRQLLRLPLTEFSKKDQRFIMAEHAAGRLTPTSYTPLEANTSVAPVGKFLSHYKASARIDGILDKYWKKQGVQPREFVDDATFLRRSYLRIIGRIPTHAEAVHFLNDDRSDKRHKLIDQLLDSPGYVSHHFNLWADVLRAKSTGKEGGERGGIYYVPWLKEQVRQNTPYDTFVKSLLTADGYPWDNPAVAYYLRDFGMPLDNMSMTAQIFLGTQLQCAQCHNHPTDEWTQQDFYQLSAFTYGMRTGLNIEKEVPEIKELVDYLKKKELFGYKDPEGRRIAKATKDFLKPLRYGVINSDRKLKLPHDYQYDDAEPKSAVEPAVLYGELARRIDLHNPEKRVEGYAEWMISENNHRFTKVIANRMWKHAMGKGLIEPVDNLTATSVADIPELMIYLEELMQSLDYDLKQYLRVIYNTRYYQREAVIDNPDLHDDYQWEGPVFQRMSAEQIWDSIATLMTPDIDSNIRDEYTGRSNTTSYHSDQAPSAVHYLQSLSKKEMVAHIQQLAAATQKMEEMRTRYTEMRNDPKLNKTPEFKEIKKQNDLARKEYNAMMNPSIASDDGATPMMGMSMMNSSAPQTDKNKQQKTNNYYSKHIRRASELNSPEKQGHLLQVFGQSDRELIENSESSSNVIQALFLMNSDQTNKMMAKNSTAAHESRLAKTPEEKLDALYLGFLSRHPTEKEQKALASLFIENPEKATERVVWAMMNTQQFLFIQ